MEVWKSYRLGDVINVLDYKRIPLSSKERGMRKGVYPYYGAQGIIDYIDDFIFNGEYLLIAEDGENLKSQKQNIAQIAKGKYWVNNHAHIVESNGKCDIRYICYLLNSMDLSGYITGSAQPKLNQANLLAIELRLPSLSTQIRFSDFLSRFDDKIALNNRINHNLVEQAKAMYKSWFIDFEPFKSLDFTDSDFGMVPAVWQIRRAEELCPINIGKTPPRKESQWFSSESSDPVWVSISDMSDCGVYIDDSSEKLTNDAIRRFNVIIVPADSVLLSFKLTIGRVAIANRSLTTNEAIARFVTNDKRLSVFLYLTLLSYDYSKLGSTSSIATAVNSIIVKAMPILWPGKDVVTQFAGSVVPLFDEINKRQAENRCLVALRDTMLPKLMTGQLTC